MSMSNPLEYEEEALELFCGIPLLLWLVIVSGSLRIKQLVCVDDEWHASGACRLPILGLAEWKVKPKR